MLGTPSFGDRRFLTGAVVPDIVRRFVWLARISHRLILRGRQCDCISGAYSSRATRLRVEGEAGGKRSGPI